MVVKETETRQTFEVLKQQMFEQAAERTEAERKYLSCPSCRIRRQGLMEPAAELVRR